MSHITTLWYHNNSIAEIRLTRPAQSNALSFAMMGELIAAAESLIDKPELRAVILSGEGKNFCAGLDLSEFTAMKDAMAWVEKTLFTVLDEQGANLFQRCSTVWADVPVPVIAALHGATLGGGLQIVLGADIRLATEDSKLSVREMVWGLIPDMGITRTLTPLMPMDKAADLMLTARMVKADEAASLGLVTRLCEDSDAEAMAMAQTLAAMSPDAIRACKTLYRKAWQKPDAELLKLEARLQHALIGSPNQMEAVMAGMQKRPAVFKS